MTVWAALCVDTDGLDRLNAALRYLAIGLVDQAVQVRLISADPRIEDMTLGPIQTLVHERIAWPAVARRTRQLVDALAPQPPTVVQGLSHGTYGTATALARAYDADLVIEVTTIDDAHAVLRLDRARVQRYVASSEPLRELLTGQLGIEPTQVELVRPGVLSRPEPACFAEADRDPTVLCFAPLERESGVAELLQAVALLREREHSPLVFLVEEGRHERALRRLARELRLSEAVTFAQPLGDIVPALRSGDIFVEPGPGRAFTVASLHAMAAGMAVVAGPQTACDHFRDGETAVVCPELTPAALADAMHKLLSAPDDARELGRRAIAYVRTHHSSSESAVRMAAIYRELALARATFPMARQAAARQREAEE